jgi:murein DD-endopeptidase MepM/ murein hydrolase activator NlpD
MDFKTKTAVNNDLWLSLRRSVLLFVPIICLFMVPHVTHAGIVSFLTNIFSGDDVSAQVETETIIESSSQDMDLPAPANNFDPSLKVASEVVIDGGEALLPEVGPSTDAPDKVNFSNGQISTYIVRSGDTLAKVADMFDVSVNTILWANDLTKGSALRAGQNLVILPISGVIHTVVAGDSLNSIAKKYGGDIDEIADFNDMKASSKLAVGDKIVIPDGQVSSSIRPSATKSTTSRLISSAGGPAYDGYYLKPFIGGHKTQGLHGYNGVDYGMPVGTPLYASAAGKVIISKSSGWNGGYGDYVVIQHPNSTQTVYGHMSSVLVSVGQTVVQGQLIGYSGNTGKSTGPHLHFEIRGAKNPF